MPYPGDEQRRKRLIADSNRKKCRSPDQVNRCKSKQQCRIRVRAPSAGWGRGYRVVDAGRLSFSCAHGCCEPTSTNADDSRKCRQNEARDTAPFWSALSLYTCRVSTHSVKGRIESSRLRRGNSNSIVAGVSSLSISDSHLPLPTLGTITNHLILRHLQRFPQVDAQPLR